MTLEHLPRSTDAPPIAVFERQERRTIASYRREIIRHRRTEIGLRQALAREEALLAQKDELIRQQAVLSQESDHRLLNGIQMIVSLLSLQSRASTNVEVASQLAGAADRIGWKVVGDATGLEFGLDPTERFDHFGAEVAGQ